MSRLAFNELEALNLILGGVRGENQPWPSGKELCTPEEIKQVQGECTGSSVRLADLPKVLVPDEGAVQVPCSFLAAPFLSVPDRRTKED